MKPIITQLLTGFFALNTSMVNANLDDDSDWHHLSGAEQSYLCLNTYVCNKKTIPEFTEFPTNSQNFTLNYQNTEGYVMLFQGGEVIDEIHFFFQHSPFYILDVYQIYQEHYTLKIEDGETGKTTFKTLIVESL